MGKGKERMCIPEKKTMRQLSDLSGGILREASGVSGNAGNTE